MLTTAALLVSLTPAIAATAAAPPAGQPSAQPPAEVGVAGEKQRPSVTRTGTVRRLAVDRRRGPARTEWYLEDGDRDHRLVSPGSDLTPGTVATVTGPTTRRGLVVEDVTTRTRAAQPPRATGRRDVVVLKAVQAPSQTAGSPWFIDKTRELVADLSEGRAKLRIRELPWTKIRGFDPCSTRRWASIGRTMREAARRQGYRIGRPDHLVYYTPCFRSDGIAGVGELPGDESWIFRGTDQVVAHELGHNYGLHHAGLRRCRAEQFDVPDSDRCFHERYDDTYDLMGRGRGMSAVHQARLGWLGNAIPTVRESTTRTLVPVESSAAGTRGLRVVGPEHTWWLDVDRVRDKEPTKYPGGVALHVRRQLRDGSLELWHLVPQLNPYNVRWVPSDVGLPLTSTWTTPDGVRLDVLTSSRGGVRVEVDPGAPAPEPPAPPSDIRVETMNDQTVVTFRQSTEDNGTPIWGYDVSSTRGGVPPCEDSECNIETPYAEHQPGRPDSVMYLLDLPARTTRVEVRAISAAGRSESVYSEEFVPRTSGPTIDLYDAVDGPIVSGRTQLRVTAEPSEVSGSELSPYVTLFVNGERTRINAYLDEEGRHVNLALGSLPNGPTTLMVEVEDEHYRTARSEPIDVVVDNPVLRITSPLPGEKVSHLTPVTYEVDNRQDFDFTTWSGAPMGDEGEVVVDAAYRDGPFNITITLYDSLNGDVTASVPVIADNVLPTILLPGVDGATVSTSPIGPMSITPDTWPWERLLVHVDGTQTLDLLRDERDQPVLFPARLSEGTHTAEIVGIDGADRRISSGLMTFVVDHPDLSVRVDRPSAGSVVSGAVIFRFTPLPASWEYDRVWVEVEGLGAQGEEAVRRGRAWWDTTAVPDGSYRARVVVTDPTGNQGASDWMDLTVLNGSGAGLRSGAGGDNTP